MKLTSAVRSVRGEPWAGKRVLVLGMARSGLAAGELLLRAGVFPVLCDRKPVREIGASLESLVSRGAVYMSEEAGIGQIGTMDALVMSPGIPLNAPVPKAARSLGIPILGEMELAWRFVSGPLYAITGTNGKTTTVSLLGEIMRQAGRAVHVTGNIGYPLSSAVLGAGKEDVFVAEVSSFQMETMHSMQAQYAAVLNLTPDHLNRHGTMQEYARLKRNMLLGQGAVGFSVLNWDCEATRQMAEGLPGQVYWFSTTQVPPRGGFVREDRIIFKADGTEQVICDVGDIRLPGKHNLENALAAACLAMLGGVQPAVIRHAMRTFAGVEHRMEFVLDNLGVRYINDSKGTNPDATIRAVEAMTAPAILLAGGYDKQVSFDALSGVIRRNRHIRQVILYGQTADKMALSLRSAGFDQIKRVDTMQEAVQEAHKAAEAGCTVLFSPACASFDQFADYEERGRQFKMAVTALAQRQGT